MCALGKFQLTILDLECVIYKKDAFSLFAAGDKGEFEILAYHYPMISLLKDNSDLIIDWKELVAVRRGILKFFNNQCVVMVEMAEDIEEYYPDLFFRQV
jgi:F0F1-type ATP synthase epsilon subunit